MDPEMIGEAVDPLGEQRDLDRGRPRVPLVLPVLPDRRRLVVHRLQFPNSSERANLGARRPFVKPHTPALKRMRGTGAGPPARGDRKSTRLNSSHTVISY